jgi:alpha-beta hydrolase superfamily lysophospholipase
MMGQGRSVMGKSTIRYICMAGVFVFMLAVSDEAGAVKFHFKEPLYANQALRTMSSAVYGGADIGECLKTVYRIKEGDDNSWYREWYAAAELREKTAERFLSQGRLLSAKKEYFRAANYYRTAEFFLHTNPSDPRILGSWGKSRESFIKGARVSVAPIRPVEIPFEGKSLPGYLCLVDDSRIKRPLLLIQTGFDGTAEELYFQAAVAALERGYNCLIFEGPGQGRVIREQKIPFRSNWETVLTPVLDYAGQLPEADPERMALYGISFGGYLAPRAAAFEPRIKALIVNGGVYDFHAVIMKNTKGVPERMLDDPAMAKVFDRVAYGMMKKDPAARWAMANGMFTFGARTPSEWLRMTRSYHMKDAVGKIRCPVLVVDSEKDADMPGQSKQFFNALTSPKTFLMFTAEDAAEDHCQVGAGVLSNEKILDWLDETMKIVRPSVPLSLDK